MSPRKSGWDPAHPFCSLGMPSTCHPLSLTIPSCLLPALPYLPPTLALVKIGQRILFFPQFPMVVRGGQCTSVHQPNSLHSGAKVLYNIFVTLLCQCKELVLAQECFMIAPKSLLSQYFISHNTLHSSKIARLTVGSFTRQLFIIADNIVYKENHFASYFC